MIVRGIYLIRMKKGWSLERLTAEMRLHDPEGAPLWHSFLSRFERLERNASQRTLQTAAAVLGCSVDALLTVHTVKRRNRIDPHHRPERSAEVDTPALAEG